MSVLNKIRGIVDILESPRRFLGLFRWALLPSVRKSRDKRLLMVYDLSAQPFSIGDILVFQEASLVLRDNHGVNTVDFALVCDPARPASSDPQLASIKEDNFMFHLASVLPVAQVNPHLGSFFVFNSLVQLQRFVVDNIDFYHVWPNAWLIAKRQYLIMDVFHRLLYEYYQEHKNIPELTGRPYLTNWATGFYRHHVYPNVPVSIQLRRNPKIDARRNTHSEHWRELFLYCEGRYPAKFVVVCAHHEVDPCLRNLSNVVIAKDQHTTIEQDLALVSSSAIHMGATSGPGTIALFGRKPFLFVNSPVLSDNDPYLKAMIHEGGFLRFYFSGPLQRFSVARESPELLITEFERMWRATDKDEWTRTDGAQNRAACAPLSWLR